jgi:hypothetical protein
MDSNHARDHRVQEGNRVAPVPTGTPQSLENGIIKIGWLSPAVGVELYQGHERLHNLNCPPGFGGGKHTYGVDIVQQATAARLYPACDCVDQRACHQKSDAGGTKRV